MNRFAKKRTQTVLSVNLPLFGGRKIRTLSENILYFTLYLTKSQ